METYKLGNKVKAILRAHTPGQIGNVEIQYSMQPYTILDAVDAQVIFRDNNSSAKSIQTLVNYNIDFIDSVNLNNVKLTDKIVNLIFSVDNAPLKTISKNYSSNSEGLIYLPSKTPLYQVFVYNDEGELEAAYDSLDVNSIQVSKPLSGYLLVYLQDAEKGFSLNRMNSVVLALDLEVVGNENDSTNTMWLHFDKCSLSVNKNLYFNNDINSVDLTFKILKSDNDYITLK